MAFGRNVLGETRQVFLSGQDCSILPARVANHSSGFDSSSLLPELAIKYVFLPAEITWKVFK